MSLDLLVAAIEAEARRAPFSLDFEAYAAAGRDPFAPILMAGSLTAGTAVMARDLGRSEVQRGEPLIGDAGQRVRAALRRAAGESPLPNELARALLTNTVPYKPVGNRAYPAGVRERFRPFVAELIAVHWLGDVVITMGTEAFLWFRPYCGAGVHTEFWARDDRFERTLDVTVSARCGAERIERRVTVAPLPHPSPLNQRWLKLFPALLDRRLKQFGLASA